MRPDFKILADSRDVTAVMRDRLMELRITDEAGVKSDSLEIRLDDRAPGIEMPRTGAKLSVSLGYEETGLADMGEYTADEIGLELSPRTMTIRGRSADMRQAIKAPKTRPWDNVSLGDIVSTIAGEHGYTPHTGNDLAAIVITHLDQTEESDLHLLTRLAAQYGAMAKPAGGTLFFVKKGKVKSAGGNALPTVELSLADITSGSVTLAERGKYKAVRAEWFDTGTAEKKAVTVGSGEPLYTLRHTYPDASGAKAAAEAKLTDLAHGVLTIRLGLPGDTRLMAEGAVLLSGIRSGIDGEWRIKRVTHSLSSSGYSCEIEGEKPE